MKYVMLAALGHATASTPSHTAGQKPEHVGIPRSSSPATEVVLQHAQSEKVIVEKLAKMPVIGNGIVTATPVSQQKFAKSDKVIVEKLAKILAKSDKVILEKPAKMLVEFDKITVSQQKFAKTDQYIVEKLAKKPVIAVPQQKSAQTENVIVEKLAQMPVIGNGIVTATAMISKDEQDHLQEVLATSAKRSLALGRVSSAVNSSANNTGVADAPNVWCGGLYAASCGACPQGNGAMWCHGDCQWTGLQCQAAVAPPAKTPAASKAVATTPTAVATKLPWTKKRAVPAAPTAAIHQGKASKAITHVSQASQTGVAHFLYAHKKADECTCAFHGVCTCEVSMEFMECISSSCAAGCDCHDMQYHDACHNLQSACGDMGLTFDCSSDKATCVAHEHTTTPPPPKVEKTITHSRPLPHLNPPKQTDPVTFIYQSLQEMKEDKCALEASVMQGYVNADDRLGILVPQIEAKLGELENRCLKIPELRCDKDFEEFSGYPEGHHCAPQPPPAPKKSGSSSTRLALGVVAFVAALNANP